MTRTHAALISVLLLGGFSGCASHSAPEVPTDAELTPINKPVPQAVAQARAQEVVTAKPTAFSPSEISVFRNLDPERYEVLSRSSR